jgi:hypothetical protein
MILPYPAGTDHGGAGGGIQLSAAKGIVQKEFSTRASVEPIQTYGKTWRSEQENSDYSMVWGWSFNRIGILVGLNSSRK